MKSKISVGDRTTLTNEIAALTEKQPLQISRTGGVCSMAPSRRRASVVNSGCGLSAPNYFRKLLIRSWYT